MANRHAGPRQAKQWDAIPGISQELTTATTFLGGSLAFAAPLTILRMLGEYTLGPSPTPVADDFCSITVAIGVVSTDAFAVGATAMPDPAGEEEYPWLFWAQHPLFFPAATVDQPGPYAGVRHTFDIRSMRKMKPRESLAVIVSYSDLNGLPPVRWIMGSTRVLVGLH